MRIIKEHPTYDIVNDNCQAFVRQLLQFMCPGSAVPDTIQCVLKRLRDAPNTNGRVSFPGTYPTSVVSTDGNSIVTIRSEVTWFTASGTSWVTAFAMSEWISDEQSGLEYRRLIGQSFYGEVHEVSNCIVF